MVAMANLNIPDKAMRQQVASAIELVVQLTRLSDGRRGSPAISEITGMEQGVITMQDIFVFERTGLTPEGRVRALPRHRDPAEVRPAVGTVRLQYGPRALRAPDGR